MTESSRLRQPLTLMHAAMAANFREREAVLSRAKARQRTGWYESDDPYAVTIGQLAEPVLLVPFWKLRLCVSLVLGRDVVAHEFMDTGKLRAEVDRLLDPYRA